MLLYIFLTWVIQWVHQICSSWTIFYKLLFCVNSTASRDVWDCLFRTPCMLNKPAILDKRMPNWSIFFTLKSTYTFLHPNTRNCLFVFEKLSTPDKQSILKKQSQTPNIYEGLLHVWKTMNAFFIVLLIISIHFVLSSTTFANTQFHDFVVSNLLLFLLWRYDLIITLWRFH